jgi:hypothetical protein
MRKVVLLVCACVLLRVDFAPAGGSEDGPARKVAFEYLEAQFGRAADDASYWQSEWQLATPLSREHVTLGSSYRVGLVLAEDLELLATTGAIEPRYGYFTYFPVLMDADCVKLLIVHEEQGRLQAIGRKDCCTLVDSLAMAYVSQDLEVTVVSLHAMGTLIILANEEMGSVVVPLGQAREYLGVTAPGASLPYESAIRVLQPLARQVVDRKRNQ